MDFKLQNCNHRKTFDLYGLVVTSCFLILLQTIAAQNTFSATVNSHQFGGTQMTLNNVSTCLSGCIASTSCLGADFNFNDNTCFFHNVTSACSALITKAGCISYKRTVCSAGMHLGSASLEMNYNDEQTCVMQCIASSTCFSVDYNGGNPSGHRCFFHLNSTTGCPATAFTANSAVNHYNSMRCSTTEMMTIVGVHGSGGVLTTVVPANAYGCFNTCANTTTCIAADWETAGSACYFHNALTCGTLYIRTSVIHFRIKACAIATTTTSTSTTTNAPLLG